MSSPEPDELNSGAQEEQQVLTTTEPSLLFLHSSFASFYLSLHNHVNTKKPKSLDLKSFLHSLPYGNGIMPHKRYQVLRKQFCLKNRDEAWVHRSAGRGSHPQHHINST